VFHPRRYDPGHVFIKEADGWKPTTKDQLDSSLYYDLFNNQGHGGDGLVMLVPPPPKGTQKIVDVPIFLYLFHYNHMECRHGIYKRLMIGNQAQHPPSAKKMAHQLPALSYPYNALEPYISEEIMVLHHTKHHQTYVNALNASEKAYADAGTPKERIALQAAIKFNGGGKIEAPV
jgi:hypothetical protein